MALTPPRLPLALRLLNRAGAWARAGGWKPVCLDEETLLERACKQTGLSDFGDPAFHEGLRRLLDSYENEAALTVFGRITAQRDTLRLLENRLRLQDCWTKHPEILTGRIEQPIFILGMPRTGTSILHELLALDPACRVPMTWEVMSPWPPPETGSYQTDPRISEVDQLLAGVDKVLPGFKRMHPMGASLPQECAAITALDFMTMIAHTSHRVPSYQAWLEQADQTPAYQGHKRQLQYFQWKCPGAHWVLKTPAHLWSLDTLLDTYPDARIVQCHRDPLKVIASLTSLITTLRGMASDQVDPLEIGADWTKRLAEGLQAATDVRERRGLSEDRVLDVQFRDFMQDEIGMVRRIYEHFGLEFTLTFEARLSEFLASHAADQHGAHKYTLADAGLEVDAERRRYAAYQERYGVESEAP